MNTPTTMLSHFNNNHPILSKLQEVRKMENGKGLPQFFLNYLPEATFIILFTVFVSGINSYIQLSTIRDKQITIEKQLGEISGVNREQDNKITELQVQLEKVITTLELQKTLKH